MHMGVQYKRLGVQYKRFDDRAFSKGFLSESVQIVREYVILTKSV